MGICAACSGLATVVGAPFITSMVEKHSITFAMHCETVFLVIALVFCMILIRNYPDETLHFKEVQRENKQERLQLNWMFFTVVVLGMLSGAFFLPDDSLHNGRISSIPNFHACFCNWCGTNVVKSGFRRNIRPVGHVSNELGILVYYDSRMLPVQYRWFCWIYCSNDCGLPVCYW